MIVVAIDQIERGMRFRMKTMGGMVEHVVPKMKISFGQRSCEAHFRAGYGPVQAGRRFRPCRCFCRVDLAGEGRAR